MQQLCICVHVILSDPLQASARDLLAVLTLLPPHMLLAVARVGWASLPCRCDCHMHTTRILSLHHLMHLHLQARTLIECQRWASSKEPLFRSVFDLVRLVAKYGDCGTQWHQFCGLFQKVGFRL